MGLMDNAKNMMGNMDMDQMKQRFEQLRGKVDRNEASEDERNEYSSIKSKLNM